MRGRESKREKRGEQKIDRQERQQKKRERNGVRGESRKREDRR